MIFYPFYILLVLAWAMTMLLISPWVALNNRIAISSIFTNLYEKWIFLCCGIRVVYTYEVPLPLQQNYIIMANHESAWDAYCLTVIRQPSVTVLKQELLNIPIFGLAVRMLKPISLNRKQLIQSMKRIYSQGQERLNQGYNLLIFPQGTRSVLPTIGKFNPSAINLSLASGYPILPVAHNAGEFLPVGKLLKYPGTLNVCIGKPLHPGNHSKKEFSALVMSSMNTMLKQVHRSPIKFQ